LAEIRKTYLSEDVLGWAKAKTMGKRPNTIAGPSVSPAHRIADQKLILAQRQRADPASSPVKKRTKSAKAGPRKKRRLADSDEDDAEEESENDGSEEEAEASVAETEEEVDEGEPVVGRGGRRGAKVGNSHASL